MVAGLGSAVVQSGGSKRLSVVSTFTGLNGPLLCRVALPFTVNGEPAVTDGGSDVVAPVTFTSAFARMFTLRGGLVPELLAPFGSVTCN